MTEHYGVDWFM